MTLFEALKKADAQIQAIIETKLAEFRGALRATGVPEADIEDLIENQVEEMAAWKASALAELEERIKTQGHRIH